MSTYGSNGLTALGDPTRRAIFERLAAGPKPVGELAHGLPVSRPAVSQHLKLLKAQPFETGVVHLVYAPDPNPPTGSYEEAKEKLPEE